jgi:tetratricopeptide (TPR) repeat protein
MKKFIIIVLLLLGITLILSFEYRMERILEKRPFSYHLLYLPSGEYLKVCSLGFHHILADIIYLWSIQFYSNYQITYRYDYLEHIYMKIIPELDPHYLDPFLIGALIMSVEAKDLGMALNLLDRGMELNPEKWILAYDAGMYCYASKNYEKAAVYFEKALKAPDAHPSIRRIYAAMFSKMGDKETSYRHWLEIYETTEDEYAKNISEMHVHDLKIELDLEKINRAIRAYRQSTGFLPHRLADLVRQDFLDRLPADPNGKNYLYEREKGVALPATPLILKR